MYRPLAAACALLPLLGSSCETAGESAVAARRGAIRSTRDDTLHELHALDPSTRTLVANAVGHAVFGPTPRTSSAGDGRGIAVDNATGAEIYMRMTEAGIGLGSATGSLRVVFVFTDRSVMRSFIEDGFHLAGAAHHRTPAEDPRGGVGATLTLHGMYVFVLTDAGLASNPPTGGTNYRRDDTLN